MTCGEGEGEEERRKGGKEERRKGGKERERENIKHQNNILYM